MSPLQTLLESRRSRQARIAELRQQREHIDALIAAEQIELDANDAELIGRFEKLFGTFNEVAGSIPSKSKEAEQLPSSTPNPFGSTEPQRARTHDAKPAALWNVPTWAATLPKQKTPNPLVEAISRVLADADRPMSLKQIYDTLVVRNVVIPGKNPKNNVSAHLSTNKTFMKTSEGWTLRANEYVKELMEEKQTPA